MLTRLEALFEADEHIEYLRSKNITSVEELLEAQAEIKLLEGDEIAKIVLRKAAAWEKAQQRKLDLARAGAASADDKGPAAAKSVDLELLGVAPFFKNLALATVAEGQVLCLKEPSHVLWAKRRSQLFIRPCFEKLAERIIKAESAGDAESAKHVVTGTPGIGKSWFVSYFIWALVTKHQPPPAILFEHFGAQTVMWCFTPSDGVVRQGTRDSFEAHLDNPATWYLVDGMAPFFDAAAHTVLVTSPQAETYKDMLKNSAEMLYMPVWEEEELVACRRALPTLYGAVGEDRIKQLYSFYGGVPRYVLQLPARWPTKDNEQFLHSLYLALNNTDMQQVAMSIGAVDTAPEASNRIVHFGVNPDTFTVNCVTFASDWVANEFASRALDAGMHVLAGLVGKTAGAMRGHLHQALMHAVLTKGGSFRVRPLGFLGSLLQQAASTATLELHESSLRWFSKTAEITAAAVSGAAGGSSRGGGVMPVVGSSRDSGIVAQDTAGGGTYWRPRPSKFKGVDSILQRPDGSIIMFQMTVSTERHVNIEHIEELLAQLPLQRQLDPQLYIVVPENVFGELKVARKAPADSSAGDGGRSSKRASNVSVFALLGSASPAPLVPAKRPPE